MRERLYLLLYRLFRTIVHAMPPTWLLPLLHAAATALNRLDRKHHHIAEVNLSLTFGQTIKPTDKEAIIAACYRKLLENLAFFLKYHDTAPEKLLEMVHIEGSEHLQEALAQGKPLIFITAHYGNWELIPRLLRALAGPLTIVGRPLDAPQMDRLLRYHRERFDIAQVNKKGALKKLIAAMQQGRHVGLLVDHHVAKHDGIDVLFFGKKVRQSPGASLLAMRFQTPILPVFIDAANPWRYTLRFMAPIIPNPANETKQERLRLTQCQANAIEAAIRQHPEEWFWLHRRFKAYHLEAYQKEARRA